MTTQELKQYIDKVLGNSIRCLLPSYWWKRLFNQVADRIDEIEQSTSQLIENKVNEVKMPIVESVDELEKLNVEKGGVAAVEKVGEPVIVNYEDCYISDDYVIDWDKYTIVRGVSEIGEVPLDAERGVIPLVADKYNLNADTLVVAIDTGVRLYCKYQISGVSILTLDKVNEYLASGRYRLVEGNNSGIIAQYFTFYSTISQPSLYIKGDSWERLAKENDLEAVGSGDALVFGAERYAYVSRERDEVGNITESELTDEQIAYNIETVSLLASGEKVYLSYDGTFWMKCGHDISSSKATYFFSTISMTLMSSDKLWGRMMAVSSDGSIDIINTTVSGSSITVDSELSDTSENPVQNKAVYAALQSLANDFQFSIDILSESDRQISQEVNNKVDKTYVDNAIANAITTTLNTEV